MKAQSYISPPAVQDLGDGTYLENSNIQQLSRENEVTGELETYFEYDSEKKIYPVVPEEVAAWRLKNMSKVFGLNDDIEGFFEALPEPEKSFAVDAWNYGTTIRRDSPLLFQFCNATGTDPEIIDNIFRDAFNLNI